MTAVAQGFRVRNIAQNEADEIENRRRSRLGPVQSGQPDVVVASIKSIWEISEKKGRAGEPAHAIELG